MKYPYYKGLSGLRFIAAIFVALFHISRNIDRNTLANIYNFANFSIFQNGGYAVEFFFVLSGFLISSLLFKEYETTGTINIKHFYIRRGLRIWPVYYLLIFIYFFIVPSVIPFLSDTLLVKIDYAFTNNDFVLFICMLPNIVVAFGNGSYLNPLWSIGVEEQFYAIWAPLIKFFYRNIVTIFFGIIIIKPAALFIWDLWMNDSSVSSEAFYTFARGLKFESMAIGGVGAYIVHKYPEKLSFIFNNKSQSIMIVLLSLIFCFNITLSSGSFGYLYLSFVNNPLSTIFTSSLFICLILNVSLNDRSWIKTEHPVLNFLGDISYGIYMYHLSIEMFLLHAMRPFLHQLDMLTATFLIYTLFVSLVILSSYISYRFFERYFLKLKQKFDPSYY